MADYIRYNATTQQVDTTLMLSVPANGPVTDNAEYVSAADGWAWMNFWDPSVQEVVVAWKRRRR